LSATSPRPAGSWFLVFLPYIVIIACSMKIACVASLLLPVASQDVFLKSKETRPNIIWVMADDLGWGEVGLYPATSEHGRIATPHLDTFGKQGVQFTHSYAGYTVCAPSRTTFFTGRHSGQFVKHGYNGMDLYPDQNVTTLAGVLKSAGYATGAFGKTAPLSSPESMGFDHFFGQIDQTECHNMYPRQIDSGLGRGNVNLTLNWKDKSRELCMADPDGYNYTIDSFHDAGMAWLEAVATESKPFFLYLSFTIPHAGGWTDAPDNEEQGNPVPSDLQYDDASWPDVERDHAAVVTYLDGKVGDLMARVKALGIDDNTLVVFASDNGAHVEGGHQREFFNSTGGLQGHKRSMYEGGYRSPTMARWPGVISPGRVSSFPWAFWDAMPTFAELARTQAPEGIDGISIVPTLTGKGEQAEHEYLYWSWRAKDAEKGNNGTGYSMRIGDWKGIVFSCNDTVNLRPSMADNMKLFDVVNDPFESVDRAAEQADRVRLFKELIVSKNVTCECYQCL